MSAGQCSVLSLSFLMCLVSCSVGEATPEQTDQRIVFYVFGSENIYIIDPKSKEISSTIGPDGVCTKSNNRFSRNKCSFGKNTVVRDELIFFSDMPGNRVHVIDVQQQKVVETIQTGGYPYDLYYLHWLKEVWVHTWTNSTFDVINTDGSLRKTHKAIKAHVEPGWTHGYMFADSEVKDGKMGYVTHLFNPGLHQIDLIAKAYKTFVNVSDYSCTGTFNFVYSSLNKHAFFDCYRASKKVALLEMDLTTDKIVQKWNIAGEPYVSPDGRYIVALYKSVNESANLLIASKVYVLVIPGKDSATILKSIIDIAGGVSDLVYYEKLDKKGSFIAYISLIYSDKIAVLDLDSMDSGNTQISYIVNVGSVYSAPGMHSVSRPLVASGPWLVTPASANQSLAIINIATQELYGMVKDVVGARGMVAAYSPRPNPIG
ncbi:unnamed protein product, partial [Porites evermanni]